MGIRVLQLFLESLNLLDRLAFLLQRQLHGTQLLREIRNLVLDSFPSFPARGVGLLFKRLHLLSEVGLQFFRSFVFWYRRHHFFESGDFFLDRSGVLKTLFGLHVLRRQVGGHGSRITTDCSGGL